MFFPSAASGATATALSIIRATKAYELMELIAAIKNP
jgi:hypothetical protein